MYFAAYALGQGKNMNGQRTPYGMDPYARHRELEAELRGVARLRNSIGAVGTITFFLAGVAVMFLRGYLRGYPDQYADLLHERGFIRAVFGFALGMAVTLALGGVAWRLNRRISRISAELTMLELRG